MLSKHWSSSSDQAAVLHYKSLRQFLLQAAYTPSCCCWYFCYNAVAVAGRGDAAEHRALATNVQQQRPVLQLVRNKQFCTFVNN
jgi:hypothetical protein